MTMHLCEHILSCQIQIKGQSLDILLIEPFESFFFYFGLYEYNWQDTAAYRLMIKGILVEEGGRMWFVEVLCDWKHTLVCIDDYYP